MITDEIDFLNIDHILHVLRNPYGWNNHVVRDVRLVAADTIEQQIREIKALSGQSLQRWNSLRNVEDQLIEVANFVGAKCGEGLPSGSGDTLAKAIIRKLTSEESE